MATIVEKVARAINGAYEDFLATGRNRATDEKWDDMARAAIEAMRDPTREMVNAAWQDYENSPTGVLVEEPSVGHCPDEIQNDTAYEVWQAMIDEALK